MREDVRRWWNSAQDDLEKAKILFQNKKFDGAVFYCQQSIEKGLKALLVKQKKELRKIHDLVELGKEAGLPQNFLNYCKELTAAYLYSRYPDVSKTKDIENKASEFLDYSREILKWLEKTLNL